MKHIIFFHFLLYFKKMILSRATQRENFLQKKRDVQSFHARIHASANLFMPNSGFERERENLYQIVGFELFPTETSAKFLY